MKLNVSQQMKEILTNYTDEVKDVVRDTLEEVGKEAASELKTAGSFKGTGKYKRGWDSTVETHRTFDSVVVHNKKKYRLTHLLEFGHACRGGGRSKTREFPHIGPVNEKATQRAEREIIKKIEAMR